MVRYIAFFGVSFVPLHFLCVQMIFVLDLAEWPPFGGKSAHLVNHMFPLLCLFVVFRCFPFMFRGREFRFDFGSSRSFH